MSNEDQEEEEESSGLAKRSAWGGEVEAAEATNHTCRAEVWHCMSGVMETGIKYVERPDDIYRWIYPQATGVVINCSCVQRPAACSVQSSVPRRSEEHVVQRDGGEGILRYLDANIFFAKDRRDYDQGNIENYVIRS